MPDALQPPRRADSRATVLSWSGLALAGSLAVSGGLAWSLRDTVHPGMVFGTGALIGALGTALLGVGLLSRQRQGQLRAEQGHLAALIENSSDAIVSETLEGLIVGWNPAAENLFGHTAEEAIGQSYSSLLLNEPNGHQRWLEQMGQGHIAGPAYLFDEVCRHRDGGLVEVSLTVAPIRSAHGAMVGVRQTIRDVGQQKRAAQQEASFDTALAQELDKRTSALEQERQELQNILDTVPSMIGYWDRNLVSRVANSAYQRWFGLQSSHVNGRHMRDLLGHQMFEKNLPHIEGALRGKRQTFERSIPKPSGTGLRHSLAHYIPDVVDGEVKGFYALVHDVTELTESRQKLAALVRENEALLSTIKSHALYSVTDRAGRIIDVNENFCAISGYTRAELIGQNHRIINSGTHDHAFWSQMWRTVSTGEAWHAEVCNRKKSGELYWVDSIIAPFRGVDGAIEKYISVRTDITASKAATAALAEERERLDHILTGTNAGTWEWNVQTGEARFNERWAEVIGYTLDELGPVNVHTWLEHTHPEDLPQSESLLARHFAGEIDYYECETRMRHRNGHWVWVLDRGRVSSWTADGKPERMYGTHQDISRSKEAQRRLAASESFLERAGRLAGVGGWQLDVDSGELTWSGETQRIHELPADYRLVLQEAIQYYAPHARPIIQNAVRRAMEYGEGWDLELPLITAKGRHIWVRTVGEVEFASEAAGQKPVRLVCALQDITARRAAEEALDAKRAAEAASAAKSAFLATMSHEIRTPLNATIGLCYLLDHTTLQAEQRDYLRKIQVANRSLLGVINDVLDLAKIEAGEIALESRPFELKDIFEELSDVLGPQAQRKHLAFEFDTPPGLPRQVRGDATRVGQVLMNLLSNAIKFTERGRVALAVRCMKSDAEHHHLQFRVSDTGIGIAADVQTRLFLPFVQADAATTRRFGGTGLGLSIVWQLAHMMGGEVGVHSTVGEGSEFWVTLPLGVVAVEPHQATDGLLSKLKVRLIIEPPSQGLMLGNLARALGWEAEILNTKTLPDSTEAGCDVVVIEGSADATDDALRALAAGWHRHDPTVLIHPDPRRVPEWRTGVATGTEAVDSVVAGPVNASDLFNAVNQAISRREGNSERVLKSTRVESGAAEWLPGVRVLVVDDSEINREVADRILTREGALVETCNGGQEALSLLRRAAHPFDAVLMDVQMPEIDGNEATRRIRNELGLATLPIIALTAGALTAERQNAIESGMNDFVSKPLDPRLLIRTLRRHVEQLRQEPLPLRLRPALPQAPASGWPQVDGIDSADAALRFGHDTALFTTLLERLLREFADLASEPPPDLPGTPAERDAFTARMHKLRGNAGMLGARVLHPLAGDMEAALRSGRPVGELAGILASIGRAMRSLAQACEPLLQAQAQSQQQAEPADGAAAVLAERDLATLAQLLRRQDLSALDHFKRMTPALRNTWTEERFLRQRHTMESLLFQEALVILDAAPAASAPGPGVRPGVL
jgi:PAS domain S-box-containing protein